MLAGRALLLPGVAIGGHPYFPPELPFLSKLLTLSKFWVLHYVRPALTGSGLCIEYGRPLIPDSGPGDAAAWACLLALGAVVALALRAALRRRAWGFWLLGPALFLLPTSHLIMELDTIGAQRFLYLPCVALACGGRRRPGLRCAAADPWAARRRRARAGWRDRLGRQFRLAVAQFRTGSCAADGSAPASPGTHTALAVVLLEAGREAEGRALLASALAADPAHYPAAYNLALSAYRRGDRREAATRLAAARALMPAAPDALALEGLLAEEAGRWPDALKAYASIVERRPHDPAARWNLARARWPGRPPRPRRAAGGRLLAPGARRPRRARGAPLAGDLAPMSRRDDRLADAFLFLAVLLGYLSARSAFYNFDGVACAIAVELSDFKHLVHSNHLIYGLVSWAFVGFWRALGYAGDALYPMQVLNGLLGAAGAAATAGLVRRLGAPRREAALVAGALATSYAWWMWSLEAQVYMLGALPLILAFNEALEDKPRPWLVGLLHAASMLGHAGHCVAAPALAYLLWGVRRERRDLAAYFLWAAAAVVLAYAAAVLAFVRPLEGPGFRLWLLGSMALGQDRAFQWHFGPDLLDGVRGWGLTTLRVFCDFTRVSGAMKALGLALCALPLAAVACAFRRPAREDKALALWLAGHALIYSTWEPFTIVYRVSDLPALWALAWRGLDTVNVPARARLTLLAAWAAAAGVYNWKASIGADCDPRNNVEYQETLAVAAATPPDAWVAANARNQVYYPFFGGRRPVNLRYYGTAESLARRVGELEARGEAVYATGRTLAEFPGVTDGLRVEKLAGDLVRLRAKATRKAATGKG